MARHLSMARELAELGMALVRAAATQALLAWREPPSAAAEPPTLGESAPNSTPADAAAQTQAAEPAAGVRPRPDHALAFARLSRAVRQTIALEARIAAGDIASPRRHRHLGEHPAGRRPFTLDGRRLEQATDADLSRAFSLGLLRDIAERLDDDPEIEPEDIAAIAETLRGVCGDLGIGLDPSQEPVGWRNVDPPVSASPDPLPPEPPGPGTIGRPSDPAPPPRQAGPDPNPSSRDPP